MSSETTGSTPGISIIVASKVGSPFIDQCLNSLASEAAELKAEVIVVAAGDLSYAERIAAAFPWTKSTARPRRTGSIVLLPGI